MSVTQPSRPLRCGGEHGEVERSAGSVRLHRVAASELAVRNRSAFADGLVQLGLGTHDRDKALRLRDDVAGEVRMLDDYYAAIARASYRVCSPPEAIAIADQRRSALHRLSDCFADWRFEVHATTTVEVRVPLLVIAAPDVAGCHSELVSSSTPPTSMSARLTVFGAGNRSGVTGQVATTGRVCAEHGEHKVVFVPVSATVADVTVREGGTEIGRGIQVKVAAARAATSPGVLRLGPEAIPAVRTVAHTYAHGDDPAGRSFPHERVVVPGQNETKELRIGFTAFGVDRTIAASVSMAHAVVLALELRGGHEYDLHELAHGQGIAWRIR